MTDHKLLKAYNNMITAVYDNVDDEKYETTKQQLWKACDKKHKRFHRFLHSAITVGTKRQE